MKKICIGITNNKSGVLLFYGGKVRIRCLMSSERKRSVGKVLDTNIVVDAIVKGMLRGAYLIVSYTPWWLWLIIILVGVLRFTTRKKQEGR